MIRTKCFIILTLGFLLICTYPTALPAAEELDMINRPVNTSGLTGLIFTNSPFTLSSGVLEIGAMTISENSFIPDYTNTIYPLTTSYGFSDSMEMGIRAFYGSRDEANATSGRLRGFGDLDLSFKWNFIKQSDTKPIMPGMALILTGILPTGDRDMGMNRVVHWGGSAGLCLGREIILDDYVIGIYADGQITFQDVSDKRYRDSYKTTNAGVLLPISKHRNLQMLIEYNQIKGQKLLIPHGVDYSAVTYGLRLVSTTFNITIGSQLLHKSTYGYDNSSRIIAILSKKF